MPSSHHKQLQQTLAHLHQELAAAPRIDASAKKLLRELLADIERVLHEASAPEAGTAAKRPAAPGDRRAMGSGSMGTRVPRIEALAIEFEAEHPVIAASLRQLVDLLGRVGL